MSVEHPQTPTGDDGDARLRAALGALGDTADRPRPFGEIEPRADRTSVSRRRPALIAAAALVAVSAVVLGVIAIRNDDRQLIVTSPEPSVETTSVITTPTDPVPTTIPPPATTASPEVEVEVDGPWYSLDLPGVEAGQLTAMEGSLMDGYSQTIWVSATDSIHDVLIMHQFDEPTDVTMLTGTEVRPQGPYGPWGSVKVALISDPTDLPDDTGVTADEARLSRDDDPRVFEFESYGMNGHLLAKNVLIYLDQIDRPDCPCSLPGLKVIAANDRTANIEAQEFRLDDGATVTLTRSRAPTFTDAYGGAGKWEPESATVGKVGNLPAVYVDGTRVIWSRDGFWFALAGIPADRLDEVVAALRPFEGTLPGVPGLIPGYPEGWNRLPDSPLSPRTDAAVAWTGSEVIVAGGWDLLCPPNANCVLPDQLFNDGAAFNPTTGQWRPIAPAPVGFGPSSVTVAGRDVFVLTDRTPERERVLLRYAIDEDRWVQIDDLPADAGRLVVAANIIGDRPVDPTLIVYHGSDESEPGPDYSYSTEIGNWFALPDDGLPPSFDRRIVPSGYGLHLFSRPILEPGESGPPEVVVRRYGFGGAEWETLPPTGRTGYQAWRVAGEIILNPHTSRATGGVYVPSNDTWRDLPNDPVIPRPADLAGVYGFNEAVYENASGWVLDQLRQTWVQIPPVDDRTSTSVGAVGRNLFVFGGNQWPTGDPGTLLGDAWLWVPPAA